MCGMIHWWKRPSVKTLFLSLHAKGCMHFYSLPSSSILFLFENFDSKRGEFDLTLFCYCSKTKTKWVLLQVAFPSVVLLHFFVRLFELSFVNFLSILLISRVASNHLSGGMTGSGTGIEVDERKKVLHLLAASESENAVHAARHLLSWFIFIFLVSHELVYRSWRGVCPWNCRRRAHGYVYTSWVIAISGYLDCHDVQTFKNFGSLFDPQKNSAVFREKAKNTCSFLSLSIWRSFCGTDCGSSFEKSGDIATRWNRL